jgi:CrcB protein
MRLAAWVALFGAAGSLARYAVGLVALRLAGPIVPAGTLVVNAIGSTAIGAVMSYFTAHGALAAPARVVLTAGLLGGFTTYSAFCYETWALLDRGALLGAGLYVTGTTVGCLAGCAAGVWLGRILP